METVNTLPWWLWLSLALVIILLVYGIVRNPSLIREALQDLNEYSINGEHVQLPPDYQLGPQPAIKPHLVQHLQDLLDDYRDMAVEYAYTVRDSDGKVRDRYDLEQLAKYDAIINNAELAMLAIRSPSVARATPQEFLSDLHWDGVQRLNGLLDSAADARPQHPQPPAHLHISSLPDGRIQSHAASPGCAHRAPSLTPPRSRWRQWLKRLPAGIARYLPASLRNTAV